MHRNENEHCLKSFSSFVYQKLCSRQEHNFAANNSYFDKPPDDDGLFGDNTEV